MNGVEQIVKDKTLTFEQKVVSLARFAENSVEVLNISEETQKLRDAETEEKNVKQTAAEKPEQQNNDKGGEK